MINSHFRLQHLFFLPVLVLLMVQVNAQNLQVPIPHISSDNNSIIFLRNGKMVEGKIIETEIIAGYFQGFLIELPDGSISTFRATDLRCMYVSKGNGSNGNEIDHYWDAEYREYFIDQKIIDTGYSFFESIEVDFQDDEVMILVQLLNPKSDGFIRVYENPIINTPLVLDQLYNGSRDNNISYFLKYGNKKIQLIEKGDYHFLFHKFWGECINVVKKYPTIYWKDIARHIEDYVHCEQ